VTIEFKKKQYYKDKKATIGLQPKLYYTDNQTQIGSNQSRYKTKYRKEIRLKQSLYKNKNRALINERQSVCNKKKSERKQQNNSTSLKTATSNDRPTIASRRNIFYRKHRAQLRNHIEERMHERHLLKIIINQKLSIKGRYNVKRSRLS